MESDHRTRGSRSDYSRVGAQCLPLRLGELAAVALARVRYLRA